MQKTYKGKHLSLGTWPTTGTGFQLAVGAWRTFMNEFTSLKAADVPADDDRLKDLVAAAQQAARRVRLDPARILPYPHPISLSLPPAHHHGCIHTCPARPHVGTVIMPERLSEVGRMSPP